MPEPLVVEQRTSASPSAVFRCLTESDRWIRWQGAQHGEVEATPGGIFRMEMPDGRTARGQFTEVVPDERVVFTWGWTDMPGLPPGSTTVTIEILEEDSQTLIRLTHVGLGPEEAAMHEMGWRHYLPRLATLGEGNDPGPDPGPGA